jgi:hypothetical protein
LDTLGYYSGTAYDQAGWITNDLPCSQCSTNLRGQHVGGRCPQCGRPVGLNLYGDLLQYSQPAWLRTIRGGMMTILWTTLAMVVAFVVLIAVVMVFTMRSAAAGYSAPTTTTSSGGVTTTAVSATPPSAWLPVAMGIVGLAAAAFFAFGTWRMTAPDPSGAGETQYGALRIFQRVSLFVGLGIGLITVISAAVLGQERPGTTGGGISIPQIVWQALSGIFQAVVIVAQGLYLGHLAGRVPDVGMMRRFRMVGWGMGICMSLVTAGQIVLLMLLGGAAGPGSGAGNLTAPFMAVSCANGVVGLGMLVFAIMYLVAFVQLANRFRNASAYAEAVWAQPFPAQASPGFAPPGQPAAGA